MRQEGATIKLRLLGPVVCELGARQLPFLRERPYQLLTFLAARRGWVERDELAALFWADDADATAGRRNLRRVLHAARRLDCAEGLQSQGSSMRWPVATDVADFDLACAQGQARAAIDLGSGVFAEGLDDPACAGFTEWLTRERDRIHAAWRTAAMSSLANGPHETALDITERLLAVDELDDRALRAQLAALAALGRRDEARQAYRRFATRLAEELGVEPDAATRACAAALDDGVGPATAVDRSIAATSTAAGADGALIGRDRERRLVGERLRDGVRLVTLIGPGGIGKTRLARSVAVDAGSWFDAGNVWVDLEDLMSADQIAARIAARLGLSSTREGAALQQVVDALRQSPRLLVLDNCEHLLGAAAGVATVVATVLAGAPRTAIVATSREALGLPAEQRIALDGLAWVAGAAAPDAVLDSAAARLFCQRAVGVEAAFDARRHVDGIAQICALTEGLPLALELAAAWVRLLPCSEIAAELRAGLEVLEPRSGGRSVRAAFDRSWQLAAPHEREVLAVLAVFAGDFSVEAAQAVAFAHGASLASLADKSLLRRTAEGRFGLHPVIRQCALERLADATGARRRHAEHFSHWLQHHAHFGGSHQQRTIDLIAAELSNCWAAFASAAAQRLHPVLARMAVPLWRYCELTGRVVEGEAMLAQGAAALADQDDPPALLARARIDCALAGLEFRLGRLEAAESRARAAIARALHCGDPHTAMVARNTLGLVLWQRANLSEAASTLRLALRRAQAEDDGASVRGVTSNLAIIERMRGRWMRAMKLNREVLEATREAGDDYGTMRILNNLGDLHRLRREWALAIDCFEQALQLARRTGYLGYVPHFLVNLALAQHAAGRFDEARRSATDAQAAARQQRDAQNEAEALGTLARVAVASGDLEAADRHLAAAMKLARATADGALVPACLAVHAEVLAARGRVQSAVELLCALIDRALPSERPELERLLRPLRLPAARMAVARQAARTLDLPALAASVAAA